MAAGGAVVAEPAGAAVAVAAGVPRRLALPALPARLAALAARAAPGPGLGRLMSERLETRDDMRR